MLLLHEAKKIPYFSWAYEDWLGLMIFKNFADQNWIGFNFIRSGLDSDWKISQSPHVWYIHDFLLAQIFKLCNAIHQHRRSQEGKGGHTTPKFLKFLVVLCFERQFRKQSTVARLKSTFLGKKKKFSSGCADVHQPKYRWLLDQCLPKTCLQCLVGWQLLVLLRNY